MVRGKIGDFLSLNGKVPFVPTSGVVEEILEWWRIHEGSEGLSEVVEDTLK